MTKTVNAFGKLISFPADTADDEILSFINQNQAMLDPEYKAPKTGMLDSAKNLLGKAESARREFVENHLGVDMSNYGKRGFWDRVLPEKSIATRAEEDQTDLSNVSATKMSGAPIRSGVYRDFLASAADKAERDKYAKLLGIEEKNIDAVDRRIPSDSILRRVENTANADVRGQQKVVSDDALITMTPPDPEGGFLASAKSIAGQTIKGVGRVGSDYLGYPEDNRIAEYGQSIIDANPLLVRNLDDISEDPLMAFREATGNAATPMVGMVGIAGAGAGITSVAPLFGPAAPIVAAVGQVVQWLGPVAVSALPSYSSIRDKQIFNDHKHERDAESKAIAALGAGAVGLIERAFGPQQWALSAMTKEGRAALARKFAATSRIEAIVKGGIKGSAIEGAEELVQSPIEQLASYDNPLDSENIDETLFSGAMGAIGGLGAGGAAGVITPLQAAQTKAEKINRERQKLGLNKIASSGSVDEAINAAAETVAQKPVTSKDIWDDQSARDDLLMRASQINEQKGVQNEAQVQRTETPAAETNVLGAKSSETILNQAVVNDALNSIPSQAQLDKDSSESDITAQNLGSTAKGAATEIVLPDNTTLPAEWMVVDADNVKASMKNGVNQPRDRTRAAADVQVQQIANQPDYRRMSDSPVMDIGAPTLSSDGAIVGGNGRFEGVSRGYDAGTSAAYRAALEEDAIRKGIDPATFSGMKKPVLVRRVTQPFDTKKLAVASNSGGSLEYSALERAKIDAERIGDVDQIDVTDAGDIALTKDNAANIRNALKGYSASELGSFVDNEGNLSQEGTRRLKNAILYSAYGDSKTLSRMVESTDTDMRNIVGALTKIAGQAARVRKNISQGGLPKSLDITDNLIEAVEKIGQVRSSGDTVENYLSQGELFSDIALSEETKEIMTGLSSVMRSQKRMTEFLRATYDLIEKVDVTTENIFGEPDIPKKLEVVKHAKQQTAEQRPGSLFGEETGKESSTKVNNVTSAEAGAKYSRSPEERIKDRERSRKLERALRQQGYNFTITPKDVRDFAALDRGREDEATTAERIARIFRKRITWIEAKGDFGVNGITLPSIQDTIFIDVDTDKYAHAVMGHELSHHMEHDAPEVYSAMVEALTEIIPSTSEYAKKYGIKGVDDAYIIKEIVGDIMGDNFTQPEFWNKVAAYNPNAFRKIADTIISWIKRLVINAKARGLGSEQWVTDAQKAQDIVAKAVAQYTYTESSFNGLKNKPVFQKAWHGSPHDHDKFSTEHIGKGEGAQAYGYGLYFTDTKEVAEYYKETLGNINPATYHVSDGRVIDGFNHLSMYAQAAIDGKLQPMIDSLEKSGVSKNDEELIFAKSLLDKNVTVSESKARGGKLYQVELAPKPEEYLLWDKPLSEQSENVKSALSNLDKEFKQDAIDLDRHYDGIGGLGSDIYTVVANFIGGGRRTTDSPRLASSKLHSLGIRGIKYLDGSSRGTGEGSYNYVIFDDNDVEITAKFSREQSEKNLYVAHNLTAENIRHANEIGGLAAPSLAVAKTGKDFSGFGEITLIAKPDLLRTSKVRTFDSDVYTPRHPRAVHKINPQRYDRFVESLGDVKGLDIPNIEELASNSGIEAITRSPGVQYHWLSTQGKQPAIKPRSIDSDTRKIVKLMKDNGLIREWQAEQNEKVMNAVNAYVDQKIEEFRSRVNDGRIGEREESNLRRNYKNNILLSASRYIESGGRDVNRLKNEVTEKISRNKKLENDFKVYVLGQFNRLVDEKRIYKGFTPAGKRRYIPYDMDNIIKEMTRTLRAGEDFFYGPGNIRAAFAKEFRSISEIQADRDRIISPKEMEKIKDESQDKVFEAIEALKPYYRYDKNSINYYDDAGQAIAEGRKGQNEAFKLDNDSRKIIDDLVDYLRHLPTEYFEAKAQRPVSFGEFESAVVPKGTPKDVIDILKQNGLSITYYTRGDEQSRAESVAKSAERKKALFSRSDTLSQAGVNTEESAKPSDLPEETKFQAFRRRSQDSMLRFKVVQNWLKDQGISLSEAANVYQRENISKGKTANRIEDFRREKLEPLIKRIAEASKAADKDGKFTLGDIATYLEAVHIPEANKRMRLIHKDDKATANGITDDQARKVVKQFESMPNFSEFKKLADEVRMIGTETLDMRLDAGLISQDQYDAYKETYKNWVPLRGNMSQQGFGKGMSTNAKDKRRMGHGFREDEFVIENLAQDRERAIMQIEKNKIGMTVAQFLMEAQNSNIGTIDKPEKMRVMKDFSYAVKFKGDVLGSFETESAAKSAVSRIMERRGDLLPEGKSFTQTDFSIEKSYDPHIVMMAKPQLADNEIQVYLNGHAVKLQLNDSGLARAATNAGIEQVGSIAHAARMFNRFLSKAYTAWSPDFLFMNMARDAYSGTLVLTGKKGAAFAAKTFTNYGTAIRELVKGRTDPKRSEWVSRYRAAGGNIGAAYLSDIERIGEDAVAALQEFAGARETYRMVYNEQISKGAKPAKARTMAALKAGVAKTKTVPVIGHMFKTLERVNMVIENALRLATFKTAVESGESDQQAAMLSKDLMNFNRKGEMANQMGALYLFYNPGMQGAHIVGEALFTSKHRKQVWSLLGALTTLSFILAEFARGGEDDDDREWENTPDYIKDRNLIFQFGDKQITVPVAYGFGIFHAMGNYLSDLNHGADKSGIAVKLASGVFENFSVFGNPIVGDDGDTEIRLDQVLPTLPKLIMGPGINMDSLGRQIHPTKYQDSVPDSQLMWRSVRGTAYEDIAHFMNDITGGSQYNPGAIDISPNTIKYWVTALTGGAGRFVSDITTGSLNAAEGVEPEIENVPVLRKFIREPGVSDSRGAFHKASKEATTAAERAKKALKNGDIPEYTKMMTELQPIIDIAKYASDAKKMAAMARDEVMRIQLDPDMSKAEKKMRIREIELQEQRVYDEFLSAFDVANDMVKK